jgi:flagellar motor switch protein FliM
MVDDLLSQEEIDQLLGDVSEGEQPVELSDLERDTLAEIGREDEELLANPVEDEEWG